MVHTKINDEYQQHIKKYGKAPDQLFINVSTKDELLREKVTFATNLSNSQGPFGKPVYTVNMDIDFLWVSSCALNDVRTRDLGEYCKSLTVQIFKPSYQASSENSEIAKANGEWIDIIIPREVIEFEYPDGYSTNKS